SILNQYSETRIVVNMIRQEDRLRATLNPDSRIARATDIEVVQLHGRAADKNATDDPQPRHARVADAPRYYRHATGWRSQGSLARRSAYQAHALSELDRTEKLAGRNLYRVAWPRHGESPDDPTRIARVDPHSGRGMREDPLQASRQRHAQQHSRQQPR